MKLLKYECKKLFSSQGILYLIGALLVANAVLCFLSPGKTRADKPDDEYIAGYQNDIKRVIRLAELNIADLSLGGDSYIVDYNEKVAEKYSLLLKNGQMPGPVAGYDEYILFSGQATLLFILAVIVGSAAALCEKDASMLPFLGISKKGRRAFGAKLLALFLLSVSLATVFSFTRIAVCGAKYGFSGQFAPLVSVQKMEFCPYPVSIAGYIGIMFAAGILLLFTLSVLSALIGKLTKSWLITFLCGGAVCARLCVSGFDINNFFIRYRALKVFDTAFDAVPVFTAVLLFICAVLCMLFYFLGNKQTAPGEKLRKAEDLLLFHVRSFSKRFAKAKKPRRTKRRGLYSYELKKIFLSSKLIFLVPLLLGAKICSGMGDIGHQDLYEDEYHRLCAGISGELTDEKAKYITAGLAVCQSVIAEHEVMRKKVQDGQISSGQYNEYLQTLYTAEVKQAALSKLNEQRNHIESRREEGKAAEIIYDSGWKALFFAKFDAYLYALILFLFAGIYTFEYKSGMHGLLPSVKNGGCPLDRAKFVAAATAAAALCLIFFTVDIVFVMMRYPLENFTAPAPSVIGLSSMATAETSLLWYTVLFALEKITVFALFAVIICLISKLLRKLYLILPAVVSLTFLLYLLIQDLPRWLDLASLLDPIGL